MKRCEGCHRTEMRTVRGAIVPIKLVRGECQACREAEAEMRAAVILGRKGGRAISAAKASAARRNGRKGGRPRKSVNA